ncbi:MAG: MFS transporter [Pseudomonadota bacterium]
MLALFFAGIATFALLYCVQPVLPLLAAEFGVSAAASSLALSLSTLGLALCLLAAGALSESWGRKGVMLAALAAAGLLGLLSAFAAAWPVLLAARLLLGVALSGLSALAMAYIGEEVEPRSLSRAMALFISGNAFGGLLGRLVAGLLGDAGGWRLALGGIAVLALAATAAFAWLLPPSRHFSAQPLSLAGLAGNYLRHLRNPALRRLFLQSFLLIGGFVAIFNYLAFHLQQPPFDLSPGMVGLLSLVYLVGIVAAPLAGRLVARWGLARVQRGAIALMLVGVGGCAMPWLAAIMLGLVAVTGGFFAVHAVASGEVGQRAQGARAQASALYLSAFYLGSSVVGYAGGYLWDHAGWHALLAAVAALCALAGWRAGRA